MDVIDYGKVLPQRYLNTTMGPVTDREVRRSLSTGAREDPTPGVTTVLGSEIGFTDSTGDPRTTTW